MTLEELLAREAIRATIERYTMAGDRLDVAAYAECFTIDGIMESEHRDTAQCFRYAGRAEILAWQTRWRDRTFSGEKVHQASFARHHLTTSAITMQDAEYASARTYWQAWTDIGSDHAGYYVDTFRKEDGQWLIAHRRVREDWRSPQSLFATAVERSA